MELIQINNKKEMTIKEIEKNELYNNIKMYKLLEEVFPKNKQELLDNKNIKKYIDLYKEDPNPHFLFDFHQIKEEELMLKHFKEEKQLIFKKEIEHIKNIISANEDFSWIEKEYKSNLRALDYKKDIIFKFVKDIINEIEKTKTIILNKNVIEVEYKKKVLEIENKKKENLIQKEEYYNKKKNYIQDEKI